MFFDWATAIGFVAFAGIIAALIYVCRTVGCGK